MKFLAAITDDNGQHVVIMSRDDGSLFSFVTCCPGKYGYSEPISSYKDRLTSYVNRIISTIQSNMVDDNTNRKLISQLKSAIDETISAGA